MNLSREQDYWLATHDGPVRKIVVEAPTAAKAMAGVHSAVLDQFEERVHEKARQEELEHDLS